MTQNTSPTDTVKIASLADVPQYLETVTEYLHGEWSDFATGHKKILFVNDLNNASSAVAASVC